MYSSKIKENLIYKIIDADNSNYINNNDELFRLNYNIQEIYLIYILSVEAILSYGKYYMILILLILKIMNKNILLAIWLKDLADLLNVFTNILINISLITLIIY